jgi:hypothetical protein
MTPQVAEVQNRQSPEAWSANEERTIRAIQQAESVPRAEAIRLMRRRKLDDLKGRIRPLSEATGVHGDRINAKPCRSRTCRNPKCTRGDDGGPGLLAHLRANALYCNDACRKAAERSPKPTNQASNHQCSCGSKADNLGALAHPITTNNKRLKSPPIAIPGFSGNSDQVNKNAREAAKS